MTDQKLKKIFENDRFAKHTGIEIIETGKGYCKAQLEIKEHHLNAANVIQGGAIFTLADTAFGVASNSHGQLALAINVNISFLKGESNGIITAVATETTFPKRIGAYDVIVYNSNEEILARFNGLVYRKNEPLVP